MFVWISNKKEIVNPVMEAAKKVNADPEQYSWYCATPRDRQARPILLDATGGRVKFLHWNTKYSNHRAELMLDIPTMKDVVEGNRCLIPATGFFAHRSVNDGSLKIPYYVEVINDSEDNAQAQPFFIAGRYREWRGKLEFAVVTTEANELMRYIDNQKERMPVILTLDEAMRWLDPQLGREEFDQLTFPFDFELMRAYTVSKDITKTTTSPDRPDILLPVDYDNPEALSFTPEPHHTEE